MTLSTQVVCPHDGAINRVPTDRLQGDPRCGRCHQPLFGRHPLELTDHNFDRQVGKSEVPVLVDFWAEWCGPCRMMAPAFEKAATLLEPAVRLGKLNTETAPMIATRYGIRSIPTLILFQQGRELSRQSGAMGNADQIARWAASQLQR